MTVDILVSWNFKHVVHYDKIRKKNDMKTVEMVRKIRDKFFQETAGKSIAQKIAYFKMKAEKAEKACPTRIRAKERKGPVPERLARRTAGRRMRVPRAPDL